MIRTARKSELISKQKLQNKNLKYKHAFSSFNWIQLHELTNIIEIALLQSFRCLRPKKLKQRFEVL